MVGWRVGLWAAISVLLLAPLTGYVAIKLRDRRHRLYDEARAHLLMARRGRLARELHALRHEIVEQVSRLVEEYRSGV